jgi:uncharacterized protein DUF5683
MKMSRFLLLIFGLLCFSQFSFSQKKEDTLVIKNDSLATGKTVEDSSKTLSQDTIAKKKFKPGTAALRSAILPGWGQAYNKKYWKIPIVYAALGITAAVFKSNIKDYKAVRFAYSALIRKDTADQKKVDKRLIPFVEANASSSLRNYRDEIRKNIDYSVLVFLLFWGLNVIDATVDAHLKGFDVSNDLSLKIKPAFQVENPGVGISLVFAFK